jgi:hypothetical protein
MEISRADGSTSPLYEVRPIVAKSSPAKSKLNFNRYGNRSSNADLVRRSISGGAPDLRCSGGL